MYAQPDHKKDKVSQLIFWGHWFTFFNVLLAMLIATRYIATLGWPETLLGQGFAIINLIGHFAFLGFALYLLLLFPVTLLLPFSNILRGYAAAVATLAQSILLFDTLVYEHYRLHLNPFVFDVAGENLLALLNTPILLLGPIVLLAILLTVSNALWKRLDKIQRRKQGGRVTAVLGACFVSAHLIHIWADATVYHPIIQQDEVFPLHYPATAKRFMTEQGLVDEDSLTAAHIDAPPTEQLNYPLSPLQCQSDKPKNIVVIAINGWRADLVNPTTMPHTLAWAQTSHWFPQHFSGANNYQSGLYSLLYGMLPSYQPTLAADKKPPVLLQVLQEQGYQLSLFGDDSSATQQELHTLLAPFAIAKSTPHHNAAERDSETTAQVLAHFAKTQAPATSNQPPQFALITYHSPAYYSTPIGSVGIPSVEADPSLNYAARVLFNQYRQSLHFIDNEINTLLSNLTSDTLVVLTGTHGQIFTTDANSLRNFSADNTQVPMLIRSPKQSPWQAHYATSHYGLVGTLISQQLGCANPISDYSLGANLYQPAAQPFMVIGNSEYVAIRTDQHITVIDKYGDYQVYSLEYVRQNKARLEVQSLLEVMEQNRRFLAN